MDNKQQTAVEWFIQELQKTRDYQRVINEANQSTSAVRDVVEQAKEMEKAEKIKFATDFFFWWYNQTSGTNTYEAVEKFYEQTYGGGEQ